MKRMYHHRNCRPSETAVSLPIISSGLAWRKIFATTGLAIAARLRFHSALLVSIVLFPGRPVSNLASSVPSSPHQWFSTWRKS